MILFDIFYNATNLAYMSLGQELSMDNRERANIQMFVMFFGIISTFISLVLPINILETMGRTSFIYFTIILAIVQLITMLITAFTIKERIEFSELQEPLSIIDSFKHTIKKKSFLITVLVNFCILFIQAVLFGNIFFYIFYIFTEYSPTLIIIIIGVFILSGLFIGTLFTLKINASKGLKTALLESLLFVGAGLILIGVLPGIIALSGFFLFGFGIPCGIFPFVIYHLKAYFHDSIYTTLFSLTILSVFFFSKTGIVSLIK